MIRINLIRHSGGGSSPAWRPRSVTIAVATAALLAVFHFAQAAIVASLDAKEAALTAEIESLRPKASAEHPVPRDRAGSSPHHEVASSAVRLRSLAGAAPTDLWVEAYRESGADVTIRGMSIDDEAVHSFARRLAAAHGFQAIEVTETALRDVDGVASTVQAPRLYRFTIVAKMSDGASASRKRRG